jgi:dTMP kinase
MFITFEGIEGSGKSTQLEKIANYLTEKGMNIIQTKEPGGTDIGKKIRHLILDKSTKLHHYHSELLLFFADRCEHIEQVIKPALAQNKIILCDRYKDSTYAYQHYGRGLPLDMVHAFENIVDLEPNLTLLYDCDVTIGLKRAKARANLDRFEVESLDFHEKIRQGYLTLAKNNPDRIKCITVDEKSIETLFKETITLLTPYLETLG